jgi:trigger factor
MKIKLTKLPKSEVELQVVVDEKAFAAYHDKGFKAVQNMVEIDGFRKGNASEDAIVKKYGEMIILEEMANIALRDAYVEAVKEHKLVPVADPKITITKLAKDNPLELTMVVPVMPEVELPKYKKLAEAKAKEHVVEEVTDKDIDDVVEELRKGRVAQHSHDHDHSHEGHDHDGHDHEAHEHHEHETPEGKSPTLPEVNDEFAQSFGGDFKTVVELKAKIAENLKLEKEQKTREKRRMAIMEELIKETKADLPEAMVEMELDRMLMQMKSDVTRFGGTWDDYLKHSNKTEAELKTTWRDDAHKRSMSQLILAEIARAEKIVPTDEEIETELVRLLATVQDADEERARAYLYQALSNEKVLAFLEAETK